MPEINDRVGAILGTKGKVIEFLGYGKYLGDEIPQKDVGGFNIGLPNPKIQLDSGEIIWGCQCWWGPEEEIKKGLAAKEASGHSIRTLTMAEAIKEVNEG